MLKSSLKYDFRALNKQMIPLQLSVLIAGIVGTVCMNVGVRTISSSIPRAYSSTYDPATALLEVFLESMSIVAAMILFSLVFISGFITLILVARHVYRNFYSSEGYLTFTLPVTVDQHLSSKIISGMVWLLANSLIVVVSCVILVLFGFSTEGLVSTEVLRIFGELIQEIGTGLGVIFSLELVISGIIALLMSVLQVIFSVVLGGALARTHKVLAGIGVYLLSGMVMGFISSIFSFFVALATYGMSSYGSTPAWFSEMQPSILLSLVISIGFIIAFYFLSRMSLKNSLNLD